MRALPCSQIGAALLECVKVVHVLPQQIDHHVISAFQSITGIPLSAAMIAQLQLPIWKVMIGGLSAEISFLWVFGAPTRLTVVSL